MGSFKKLGNSIKYGNVVRNFSVLLFTLISLLIFFTIIISTLDYFSILSNHSVFFGVSYLPPIWLLTPAIISSLSLYFLKKRYMGVGLIVIYTLYFLLMGDYSFSFLKAKSNNEDGVRPLSVLALNVQYYSKGAETVFNYIDSVDADVVLLSENTLDEDSIYSFKNITKKYKLSIGKKDETAILSKYPMIFKQNVDLPTKQASLSGSNIIANLYKNPHRSFSHIKINYSETEVNIISIRLIAGRPQSNSLKDQIAWGNYLARKHLEEVDFFINYLEQLDGPVIFGGDFNIPPNSMPLKNIYKIANDAAYTQHFIPCPTFRAEFPLLRIDYLFFRNGVKPVYYRRLQGIVSDHLPIYGEFVLNNNTEDN